MNEMLSLSGALSSCRGPDISNVTTKGDCLSDAKNTWVIPFYNFDNLGQALLTLFVSGTLDGWDSIMYTAMDSVGVEKQNVHQNILVHIGLDEHHAHFRNFPTAFLTLFRICTGDNWSGIMQDSMRTNCNDSPNCLTNCCVPFLASAAYFIFFVLSSNFVLMNLVVAVLLQLLEESSATGDTSEEENGVENEENEEELQNKDKKYRRRI